MTEEWRDIKGYEGLYQVSNMGRIKSTQYWNGTYERILKQKKNNRGYLQIMLCRHGEHKTLCVHRIVAETFLDNPYNLLEVNHKNEDKTDNRVENLEWCDRKYNINYGTGRQRSAEKRLNGTQSKTVCQYTLDGEFVAEYPSAREVQRQLGYDDGSIGKCCNGTYRYKTAYGYKWRYKI